LHFQPIENKWVMSRAECGVCGAAATKSCTTCVETLCDACSVFLHKGSKSTHILCKLSQHVPVQPSQIHCSNHKDERLKRFCEECKQAICLACSFLHVGHRVTDLDQFYYLQAEDLQARKVMIGKQLVDIVNINSLLEKNYQELEAHFHTHLVQQSKSHLESIQKQSKRSREILNELYAFDLSNMQDLENFNLEAKYDVNKFRFDLSHEDAHEIIQSLEGFVICIEPLFDPDFQKIYADAYTNRTKDFITSNILADKLLGMYPLNLQALALKGEARVGHEMFKFVISQPIYDANDEFAVAECYTSLGKKEEGLKLYQKSADQGCMYAEHKLGSLYFNGDADLKIAINKKEAVIWFLSAADRGFALSQYTLAYCYYLGDGIVKNRDLSVKYYHLAAEQGYSVAEHKLGHFYENAIGVEENFEEARKWYSRAASKGHEAAINALDLLISKIEHERSSQLGSESQNTYGTITENSKQVTRTSHPSLLQRQRTNIFKNNQIMNKI
jgi:hypothetical protein